MLDDFLFSLNNINVTIEGGELIVIIGQMRFGKSTLVQLINELEVATLGAIKYNGNNISDNDCNQCKFRKKVDFFIHI